MPNFLSASVTIPIGTADTFAGDVTYCDVLFVAAVFTRSTIDVVVVDDEEDTGNKSQSLSCS